MNDTEKKTVVNYLDWSDEGKPAIWRYVLAVVLGFVVWLWGSIPMMTVFGLLNIDFQTSPIAPYYTFLTGFIMLPLLVWALLGRPAYSIALPSWPSNLRDYGLGVLFQWIAMTIMYLLITKPEYRGFENFSMATILLIIVGLVGIVIQTGFEEFYFRGLIAQATHRIIKWLPAVLLVQALYFASLHAGNIAAFGSGYVAWLPYIVKALAFGWVAWRTGSLVVSMGYHFANNAFLWLFIRTEGDVGNGIAPFVVSIPPSPSPEITAIKSTFFELGTIVIFIFLLEMFLRRRAAQQSGQRFKRVDL